MVCGLLYMLLNYTNDCICVVLGRILQNNLMSHIIISMSIVEKVSNLKWYELKEYNSVFYVP